MKTNARIQVGDVVYVPVQAWWWERLLAWWAGVPPPRRSVRCRAIGVFNDLVWVTEDDI